METIPNRTLHLKIAYYMCLGSVIAWITMFVALLCYIPTQSEGIVAIPYVIVFAIGYIGTDLLGIFYIRSDRIKKTDRKIGGIIIFIGYIGITCVMIVVLIPLFIPPFKWYVYPMLAILFTGIIGAQMQNQM